MHSTNRLVSGSHLLSFALLLLLACTSSCSSPLHDAAVSGDIVLLKQLIKSGKYDVNARDASGRTPLAAGLATCSNYAGRFPRMVPNGQLQYCDVGTHDGISAMLVCAGADVNVDVFPKERPGYKLLHVAACSGSTTDLRHLLVGGADVNARYSLPDGRTVTPLTWAAICEGANKNNTEYGYPGFSIEVLLGAGANPLPDGSSKPPSALIHPKPFPLSKCNKLGACSEAEVDKIWQSAWDSKTLPDGFTIGYWRRLWEAQERLHADPQAQPVLADWFERGRQGYSCTSAADYLKSELSSRKKKAEEERYARTFPLHVAVMSNNLTAVKALLSSGKFDVNSKDDKGGTPLQAGMQCSKSDSWCWPQVDADVAELLVSKGANVKLGITPGSNYTLLHKAAFHGLTRLVKALLKGGADPNAVYYVADDKQRQSPMTPLTRAAYCDFRRSTNDGPGADSTNGTIIALLDAGANPLPFGKERPLTGFFTTPPSVDKCVKIRACSEVQMLALMQDFKSGTCPDSFLRVWRLQERLVAAAAAAVAGKPATQQQRSGRRLRAAAMKHA